MGVSQGALNEPGVHASCLKAGMAIPSLVMPARCVAMRKAPWTLVRLLEEVAIGLWWVIPPGGGKEPGRIPVGFPGGVEESEGIGG